MKSFIVLLILMMATMMGARSSIGRMADSRSAG